MNDNEHVGGEVRNPRHYNSHPAGIETIEVIEHMTFNIGTAIKYLWRHGLKTNGTDAERDLKSAIWYIERELKRMKLEPTTTLSWAEAGLARPE